MNLGKKALRLLTWLGVILLQLIMTQVVTLVVSLLLPGMENFPQTRSVLFVAVVGITFTAGVFLAGWVALKWRWLDAQPKYRARLAGALVGAYLPLIAALILYHPLEAGNPFLFISILACILGFWLPGWIGKG